MIGYKLKNGPGGVVDSILKADDILNEVSTIPLDPANRDYYEYLQWLSIPGNVPESADAPDESK